MYNAEQLGLINSIRSKINQHTETIQSFQHLLPCIYNILAGASYSVDPRTIRHIQKDEGVIKELSDRLEFIRASEEIYRISIDQTEDSSLGDLDSHLREISEELSRLGVITGLLELQGRI